MCGKCLPKSPIFSSRAMVKHNYFEDVFPDYKMTIQIVCLSHKKKTTW